jgi:rhamnosyltransferase
VDNTPAEKNINHSSLLQRFPNAVILSTGKNLGIAKSLNIGIEAALNNNASWLLTMDQDSYFDVDQAEKYFRSCAEMEKDNIAILSPAHKKVLTDDVICMYKKNDHVMTSGNLLNLEVIKKIGSFNEDLFIDSVDHDYCLRANLCGFEVLQATNCFIQHVLGELYSGTFLFGMKKKTFYIHSPKRVYFIVRNALYLYRHYKVKYPKFIKQHYKYIGEDLIQILMYSNNRTEYIRYVIKAFYDYRYGIFGNPVDI